MDEEELADDDTPLLIDKHAIFFKASLYETVYSNMINRGNMIDYKQIIIKTADYEDYNFYETVGDDRWVNFSPCGVAACAKKIGLGT